MDEQCRLAHTIPLLISLSDLDLIGCRLSWDYIKTTQLLITVDRCVVLTSIGTPEALDDCQLCQTK